jgi:NitT/TauT family transport system substrate-binding protein
MGAIASLRRLRSLCNCAVGVFMVAALAPPASAADPIRIGILRVSGSGAVFLAKEKGYFAAEGLDAQLLYFEAGQPVAVGVVSGGLDFGAAGVSSALYTLAGQGALKLIAGLVYDTRSAHGSGVLASNAAYAAGLKSFADMKAHSVGLTQMGSTFEYAIALVAAKYDVPLGSMTMVPLQSLSNVASALAGGKVDLGVLVAVPALHLLAADRAKLLGWVGDEQPWQVGAIWTSTKIADERQSLVERFLRAVRKGAHDYQRAFYAGAKGERMDGPAARATYAIIAKYVQQSPAQLKQSMGYVDPEERLDTADVARQIGWFHDQGMIKHKVTLDQVIDRRYVIPLVGPAGENR